MARRGWQAAATPGTGGLEAEIAGRPGTLSSMRKDTENRRQAVKGLADEAMPRDHLPPDSEAAVDDVAPDEPPRDQASGKPPAQRTDGEAGDEVRPHNEGQARQGPR